MSKATGFKIASLNTQTEQGVEIEILDANGEETGFFVTVASAESPSQRKIIFKRHDAIRKQNEMLERQGKKPVFKTMEEIDDDNKADLALYVTGWRGADVEYSPENAVKLCQTSSIFFKQVKETSENLALFMRSK